MVTSSRGSVLRFGVRTLDFLLRQAEHAIDAFFFDAPAVGDSGLAATKERGGARSRGRCDTESIESIEEQVWDFKFIVVVFREELHV